MIRLAMLALALVQDGGRGWGDRQPPLLPCVEQNVSAAMGVDPGSGRTRRLSGYGFDGLSRSVGLAFDPEARVLYLMDIVDFEFVTVDSVTGRLTRVGPMGIAVPQVFDPVRGVLYGLGNDLVEIDPLTGRGTVVGPAGIASPGGLAFDPLSDTLFATDILSDELFTIDPSTGTSTVVGPLGYGWVASLAYDTERGVLYGTSARATSGELVTIDVRTGAATPTGLRGPEGLAGFGGLAFDPETGTLIGLYQKKLSVIDPASLTVVAHPAPPKPFIQGLAFDRASGRLFGIDDETDTLVEVDPARGSIRRRLGPTGFAGVRALTTAGSALYGYDEDAEQLLRIDPRTGSATPVGSGGLGAIQGLAYDPSVGLLYAVDNPLGPDSLLAIDPATGVGTVVASVGSLPCYGLTFDPATGLLLAAFLGQAIVTIDPKTGSVGQVGLTGFGLRSLALDPATRTLYSTEYGGLLTVDMATGAGTTIGWTLGAEATALDPVTGLVYMADRVIYRFDPSSGRQTFATSFQFADDVQSLAFDPGDHLLYATFGTDVYTNMANQLASIDPDTGTQTVLGDIGFMDVQSLAFDPSAGMLYGVDRVTNQLIAIEPDSFTSVAVGPVGFPNVRGLALDLPTDTLYGTTVFTGSTVLANGGARGELIEIDRQTGAGTLVGLTSRRLVGLASRLPSAGWGR